MSCKLRGVSPLPPGPSAAAPPWLQVRLSAQSKPKLAGDSSWTELQQNYTEIINVSNLLEQDELSSSTAGSIKAIMIA